MKYLILALTLILAGCTGDSDMVESLTELQKDTQENLQLCKTQLDAYRNNGSSDTGSFNQPEETQEEQPAEPQYETVELFVLGGNNRGVSCYEREVEPCGMTFSECKDGYTYRCMQDVQYKVTEEQKLVE